MHYDIPYMALEASVYETEALLKLLVEAYQKLIEEDKSPEHGRIAAGLMYLSDGTKSNLREAADALTQETFRLREEIKVLSAKTKPPEGTG